MSQEDEGVSITTLLELLGDEKSNIEINHEKEEVDVEVDKSPDNLKCELGLQCKEEQVYPELNSTVKPLQTLNARGMPVRKRNTTKSYCYDDSDDEDFIIKPRRLATGKSSRAVRKPHKNKLPPIKEQQNSFMSRNVAPSSSNQVLSIQSLGIQIGSQLRNILKLPKSVRWVYCEWFYSNIDKCIFFNYKNFEVCLKTHFPTLKTRIMTRTEWNIIRRLLGKRRRCSNAFFQMEREILANTRKKIHQVQLLKPAENPFFKDLPLKIPLKLVAGTKVTARLHKPLNGIFDGYIEAIDYYNNTYWISFEQNLGIHSVPDYEVLSTDLPEIFINKNKQFNKSKMPGAQKKFQSIKEAITIPENILIKIVLSKKHLAAKENQVKLLSTMNKQIEVSTAFESPICDDFEEKYAHVLIALENINQQLKINLNEISFFIEGIKSESSMTLSRLKEKCKQVIFRRVQQISNDKQMIDASNTKLLDLVSEIRYLVLISKTLADRDQTTYTLQNLQDGLENLKKSFRNNKKLFLKFSDKIEVHFTFILMLLSKKRNAIQQLKKD